MTKNLKKRKKFAYKTGVWLAAEIWLNLIGLDNIADYSEFIFAQDLDLNLKIVERSKLLSIRPSFVLR